MGTDLKILRSRLGESKLEGFAAQFSSGAKKDGGSMGGATLYNFMILYGMIHIIHNESQ